MTLQQWITKYEQEAEKFTLLPGFVIYFEPNKGFFCYRSWQGVFEIDHTCTTNGKWAYNKCMELAKERGCKWLITATERDPAAYMRLFKVTPVLEYSGIRSNGNFYWVFKKEVV